MSILTLDLPDVVVAEIATQQIPPDILRGIFLKGLTQWQQSQQQGLSKERWDIWRQESKALAKQILSRRQGEPLDLEALWEATLRDLEEHDDHFLSA